MKRALCISKTGPTASRFVTLFALLALFLQSFALQTHIHRLATAEPSSAEHSFRAPAQTPLKSQDPLDQSGCRLCQEITQSGFFVNPTATGFSVIPTVVTASVLIAALLADATAPPFAWRSRAPPQH
jgi:hypothetical protein